MPIDNALDVRMMVPIKRHETLLAKFAALPKGESFTFTNDHDPKPLYYEFCSIHGDVLGWEYLRTDPREWTVRVTRNEESEGRKLSGVSTLIDLRKTAPSDWQHTVFHRFGMMPVGDTMELLASEEPSDVRAHFEERHLGRFTWREVSRRPGEIVVHITKGGKADERASNVVNEFDVRPHHPAVRHEMVFDSFHALGPGEAFIFTNDHDPKPLYYQLEAESPVAFTWEYLESGPEVWRVMVARS